MKLMLPLKTQDSSAVSNHNDKGGTPLETMIKQWFKREKLAENVYRTNIYNMVAFWQTHHADEGRNNFGRSFPQQYKLAFHPVPDEDEELSRTELKAKYPEYSMARRKFSMAMRWGTRMLTVLQSAINIDVSPLWTRVGLLVCTKEKWRLSSTECLVGPNLVKLC